MKYNILKKSKAVYKKEQMYSAMEKACSHINEILFVKTEEEVRYPIIRSLNELLV